ncbi:DUF4920 domain-containing protein [Penaeicola halotolerans]|uniref:DUF4920 domain-containing protein n=1 Tax=Penaeicola halotolerans TaxID=2793196 RepID=UPI001CF88030|nr:DUF4920 domain-containing protein [Penaeicola halotolerans]
MKKQIAIFSLALCCTLACSSPQETENTVASTEAPVAGSYGDPITTEEAISAADLKMVLAGQPVFEGKVTGVIEEVCSKKGCWLTMDLGNGEKMRVTFKDYGFFVPKNSAGYKVTIQGIAKQTTTDVATLRHYAEDAGKSKEEVEAINAPKVEYAFEAEGVIIEENA